MSKVAHHMFFSEGCLVCQHSFFLWWFFLGTAILSHCSRFVLDDSRWWWKHETIILPSFYSFHLFVFVIFLWDLFGLLWLGLKPCLSLKLKNVGPVDLESLHRCSPTSDMKHRIFHPDCMYCIVFHTCTVLHIISYRSSKHFSASRALKMPVLGLITGYPARWDKCAILV